MLLVVYNLMDNFVVIDCKSHTSIGPLTFNAAFHLIHDFLRQTICMTQILKVLIHQAKYEQNKNFPYTPSEKRLSPVTEDLTALMRAHNRHKTSVGRRLTASTYSQAAALTFFKAPLHLYNHKISAKDPALEMRRGGNSIVGSNPTLSSSLSY